MPSASRFPLQLSLRGATTTKSAEQRGNLNVSNIDCPLRGNRGGDAPTGEHRPPKTEHRAPYAVAANISFFSFSKSIGFVKYSAAPYAIAVLKLCSSLYAVIMHTFNCGKFSFTIFNNSIPVIPGMLISERINTTSGGVKLFKYFIASSPERAKTNSTSPSRTSFRNRCLNRNATSCSSSTTIIFIMDIFLFRDFQ